MKKRLLVCFLVLFGFSYGQRDQIKLKNVLIVAQLDKAEDRFTMEVNISEMMASCGIKTMVSLNALKRGAEVAMLGRDTIREKMLIKGHDTYMLVSVRGYDKRFKPATEHGDLKSALGTGHLFPLYRDGIASVTFDFLFYRNGKFVAQELVKLGGIGSRDDVIKKLRRKLPRRINKKWK
mgnify:CR=1 FL=1